jgi:hypothetical protein
MRQALLVEKNSFLLKRVFHICGDFFGTYSVLLFSSYATCLADWLGLVGSWGGRLAGWAGWLGLAR